MAYNIYDREGNQIDIKDWKQQSLLGEISRVEILRVRNGQFRLTPTLFWGLWSLEIIGWVACLVSLIVSAVFWAWPPAVLGMILGFAAFFGMWGLADYYKHHGMPRRVKEEKPEFYCKSCQQKLEDELEVGKEHRAQELLAELESLGVKDIVVNNRELAPGEWTPEADPVRHSPGGLV